MTTISEKRANETDDVSYKANVVLVDIEGTTTSIDFVKNTLFPYVRKNLEAYLKSKWNDEEFKEDLKLLQEQSKQDEADGTEGLVKIPEGTSEDICEDVKKNILWQMDLDRKTKALKQLQGHMWRDAYKKGEIKAHVYPDVAPALKSWKQSGKDIYVYSSGSVEAQKLLFGHTKDGDLLELFSGYFDTTVGPKVEESSYSNIVNSLKCKSEQIIFFTDVPKEARAAKSAGLQAVIVVREGNLPITDEDKLEFPVIKSFDDVVFETSVKRRKKSEEEPLEQGKTDSAVVDVSSMQDVEMQEEPSAVKTETSKATEGVSSTAVAEAVDVQPNSVKQAPVEPCATTEEAKETSCKGKDTVNNDVDSAKQTGGEVAAEKGAAEIIEKKDANETKTKMLEVNGAEKLDVDGDKQTESNGPKCPKGSHPKSDANNYAPIKTNSESSTNSKDATLNENSTTSSEKCHNAAAKNLPITDNVDIIVPDGKTDAKMTDDKSKLNDKTETGEENGKICDDSSRLCGRASTESLKSDANDSKAKVESLTDKTESTLTNTAELPNKTECTHIEKTENVGAETECTTTDNSQSSLVCKTESLKPIDAESTVTKKTESAINKTEPMETDDLTSAHTGDLKAVSTASNEPEHKNQTEDADGAVPMSEAKTDISPATDEVKSTVSTSENEAPAAPGGGKAETAEEAIPDGGKAKAAVEATPDGCKVEAAVKATPDNDKSEAGAAATSEVGETKVGATPGGGGKAEAAGDVTPDGGKAEAVVEATTEGGKAETVVEAITEGGKAGAEATTEGGKPEAVVEATTEGGKPEAVAEATPVGGEAKAEVEATPDGGKAAAEATPDVSKAEAAAEATPDGGKAEAAAEATPDGGKAEAAAEATPDGGKAEAAAEATPDGGKAEAAADGGKAKAAAVATPDGGKAEAAAVATPDGGKAEAAATPDGGKAEAANSMDDQNVATVNSDVKTDSAAPAGEAKADNETGKSMEDAEPMVTDDAEQASVHKAKPVVTDEAEPMVTDEAEAESMVTDEANSVGEVAKHASTNDPEPMVTEDPEPMSMENSEAMVTEKAETVNSTVNDGGSEKPKTAQPEKEPEDNKKNNECAENVPSDSTHPIDSTNCNSVNKDAAVKDKIDSPGTGTPETAATAKDVLDTKTESSNTENKISKAEDHNDVDNVKDIENDVKGGKNSMNSCVENGESTEKTDNTSEKHKTAAESTDKVTENVST